MVCMCLERNKKDNPFRVRSVFERERDGVYVRKKAKGLRVRSVLIHDGAYITSSATAGGIGCYYTYLSIVQYGTTLNRGLSDRRARICCVRK